jgi:hypothetical protein
MADKITTLQYKPSVRSKFVRILPDTQNYLGKVSDAVVNFGLVQCFPFRRYVKQIANEFKHLSLFRDLRLYITSIMKKHSSVFLNI